MCASGSLRQPQRLLCLSLLHATPPFFFFPSSISETFQLAAKNTWSGWFFCCFFSLWKKKKGKDFLFFLENQNCRNNKAEWGKNSSVGATDAGSTLGSVFPARRLSLRAVQNKPRGSPLSLAPMLQAHTLVGVSRNLDFRCWGLGARDRCDRKKCRHGFLHIQVLEFCAYFLTFSSCASSHFQGALVVSLPRPLTIPPRVTWKRKACGSRSAGAPRGMKWMVMEKGLLPAPWGSKHPPSPWGLSSGWEQCRVYPGVKALGQPRREHTKGSSIPGHEEVLSSLPAWLGLQ